MKPTLKSTDQFGETYEHPAFGSVSLFSTQGTPTGMFMSNVKHQHLICLEVNRAELHRRHNHDNHYAREKIIRLYMTDVQFAELMAGIGKGSGVPCTLDWIVGEGTVPRLDIEPSTKRFTAESRTEFEKLARDIGELVKSTEKELTAAKVSKPKQDAILAPLRTLQRQLGDRLPFMQDMFAETLEGIASEAKAVIEAYAGTRGVTGESVPRMLGGPEE